MDSYDPTKTHPALALHIADPNGLPLLSSASVSTTSHSSSQLKLLTELTRTCLNAQEVAARFGLGSLQRVSIETTRGAHVVQRRIEPPTVEDNDGPNGQQDTSGGMEREERKVNGSGNEPIHAEQGPPVLITTVVVPPEADLAEGRQAGEELEAVASSFQQAWLDEMAGDDQQGMNGYVEPEG